MKTLELLELRDSMRGELMRAELLRDLMEHLLDKRKDGIEKALNSWINKQNKLTQKYIKEAPKKAKKVGITL